MHGFTGSGLDFLPIAAACDEKCVLTWIAPDLPGHGATGLLHPAAAHSLESMTAVLESFARQLEHSPTVLGYSMGGRLGLSWATATSKPSIAKMVLVGASAGLENPVERKQRRQADQELANHIRAVGCAIFAAEWEQTPIIQSQRRIPHAAREAMEARRRAQDPHGLARCLEMAGTGSMKPLWNQLKKILQPSIVMAGEEDSKFVEQGKRLAQCLPHGAFQSIPLAGHCAHLENNRFFSEEFLQFQFAKREF